MCGIVGYAGFTKRISIDPAIAAIRHRGPDDKGAAYFDGVALGNVRLAILDLSPKGHQPMYSQDKSLCITYNGEIYNYKEVRRLLEKKYTFTTQTDTEVILCAYQEWGTKCLQKLNGMFAFVIYDLKNQVLFGARDRLGQKPLKYYFENGVFIFSSEIKAILTLLSNKPRLDEIAIDDFLTFQYIPSPKTGFKNIYKLPAAHCFIYKDNKLSTHRYWSLQFDKKLNLSEAEWQSLVYKEMKKAVASHLVSDVPVGALLSGGIDSSMVVALMSPLVSKKIRTFSVGFDDDKFDETRYAKQVSELYATNHTHLYVTSDDVIHNLETIGNLYDEPIGDNSILPTLLVSKLASSKVKVALTGDGGDENFAGYERYAIVRIAELLAKQPAVLNQVARFVANAAFGLRPTKLTERILMFINTVDQKFYRKYVTYNSFFSTATKYSLYARSYYQQVVSHDSFDSYRFFFDQGLSDIDNALSIDIQTYLPDDLLYKTDTASMAYGLELRSPFLAHRLMETVAQMPSHMKIRLFTKKKILKDIAISNNLLPREVIYKRKQGFTIPQNKWFKGPLKKYLRNRILSSGMVGAIFNKRKIEEYVNHYFTANLNYDNNIFALLILSQWYDTYINE